MNSISFKILPLVLFLTVQSLFAQKQKFTSDTAYLNELKVFMGLEEKKDPDPVFTQFAGLWGGGQINNSQKQTIIKISNNLVKKRARANPHFSDFLSYMLSALKPGNNSTELDNWLRVLETFSESNEHHITILDKLMMDLIQMKDSSTLFESRAVKWKHNSTQFKYSFGRNNQLLVYLPKVDLICSAKRDSSIIRNTSGYYYPLSDLWIGKNGEVSWERAGYSRDSVNAKLNNYKIELKFSEYKADSVVFTNKKFLKSPLLGHFEERILANVTEEKASYPKFYSYNKSIDIKQVVPNIDYSGGFAMEGSKFLGYGDADKKAGLFVYKGKELFAKAHAMAFVFDRNNIIGNKTHVEVFIDQDTIWHPWVNFNYLIKNQTVSLIRSGGGLDASRFYDTYHRLEIEIPEISFNLNDSLILFKSPPATTYRKAIFASDNYFSNKAYQDVAMIDLVNPLEAIKQIVPNTEEEFTVMDLATYLNKAESDAYNLLLRLSDMGFVAFDAEKKTAIPKQKLFDYIKNNYGKRDYDAISIVSEPSRGNNAELNLKDMVLTVKGVKSFVLSNNRRVGVIPEKSTIRIKKDLEIDFDGQLQAGLAWITGKNMIFRYDSFLIQLQKIDSLSLSYQSDTKNKDSIYEYTPLASTIDSITGLLRIDYPENKSGRQAIPEYPILESHGKSFVFYEQKHEGDTVYKKENFYVENYPFIIDSLNIIKAKDISFRTTLKSGGVFPDFDEDLVVMPDSSLGFYHKLDSVGTTLYGGLATYDNNIKLDNSGLKGDGRVKYLNTEIYAEKFNFFPDSMNTVASHITMLRQNADSSATRYPAVLADSVNVFWAPKKDQMLLSSLDKPFNMFEEKANLTGTLDLSTKKLSGKGGLQLGDALLNSKTYTFLDESFKADTADFLIQSLEGEKPPFLTYNVKTDVDFDKKLGLFNSNGANSYIDMPLSYYKCYMNYFSWHMGINQIDIGSTQEIRGDSTGVAMVDSIAMNEPGDSTMIVGYQPDLYQVTFADTIYSNSDLALNSKFISTHPNQDSLSFYASSSTYDVKNYIIKAKGVKFIKIADAFVYPSSTVTILPGAKINTLRSARILANRASRYHKFYDASVDIYGAKKYIASADYEYYDRLDSLQIIHFSNIGVNSDIHTIASGEIKEKDHFKLSPEFSYFGKINLKAPIEQIEFDGYTKIDHQCDKRLSSYWLEFKTIINPDSIVIPLAEQPVDNEFRKLQSSMFLTQDSMGIYPGFLTTQKRIADIPVLKAKGLLYYNVKTGYFEITDSTKLQQPEKEGNYLSFHKKLCLTLAEGKMDLGAGLGRVEVSPTGFLRHNMDSWYTQLDIMLGIDFFFSDPALNAMANKINEAYSLPPVIPTTKEYQRAFKELIGLKQRDELMKNIALIGGFSNIPPEMNKTLFFSSVKMIWNRDQNAWQSEGKIGLGNLKGTQINKMFDGYIEVKKVKSGDILNIYLEINPQNWYFFTYTRGTMKTISSDNDYNNIVTNLKDKYRKPPEEDENNPFMFFPATDRAKENFIEEMKKQKLAALENKDINLDNINEAEQNQTEQEQPENDINEDGNDGENKVIPDGTIQTEDLQTDENQKIENLKDDKEIETETETETEQDDNQLDSNNVNKKIEIEAEDLNRENKNKDNPDKDKEKEKIKQDNIKKEEVKKEQVKTEDQVQPEKQKDKNKEETIKTEEIKPEELKIDDKKKEELKKEDEIENKDKEQYEEEEEEEEG